MSDTVRKRRCWLWGMLAAVLLLVGVPIGWRLRPLNSVERQLVGDWKTLSPTLEVIHNPTYRLKANRRFILRHAVVTSFGGSVSEGSWSCSGDTLYITRDPPPRLSIWKRLEWHRRVLLGLNSQRIQVAFENDGRVRLVHLSHPPSSPPGYWVPSNSSIWPD